MRVGFIGLGMMGKGMAANLQKAGHQLIVHDLNRAAAEPFLANGAQWANSPRALAEASEAVFTSRIRLAAPIDPDVSQTKTTRLHSRPCRRLRRMSCGANRIGPPTTRPRAGCSPSAA